MPASARACMNLPVNTAGSIEPHARITLRTSHDTRPVRLEIEATGAGIGLTHLGLNSKNEQVLRYPAFT